MIESVIGTFNALEHFTPASHELIEQRHLQNRLDRKYVLPFDAVERLLEPLTDEYRVILSAGGRSATYDSLYFDTPDWRFYNDHHRGIERRFKVRVRHHLERRLTFLEVKAKARGAGTGKLRLVRDFGSAELDAEAHMFLTPQIGQLVFSLRPQLWTSFRRITLVGVNLEERITLDWDLGIRNDLIRTALPGVAVVEIKQRRYTNSSPSVEALRRLNLREHSISKYCFAAARLYPLRNNRFKPAFRALERLVG